MKLIIYEKEKTVETKVKAILAQMTVAEKAALCTGRYAFQTLAIERLGIPAMIMADGPHGVRQGKEADNLMTGSMPATCFPTASALGATWNVALLHNLGEALAEECLALGVDILLGPGINMKRSPLCGRNFEYYTEDPFLSGELAASYIKGVQSKGVGTSLKHFAANNQEFQRFTIDAQVDERALREIYLAAFERAVRQAQPWSIMCAYNRLNGPYCSQHHRLLTDILRDEWGFEGFVVSDWGAVRDRVAALAAGLDLEMPGPQPDRVEKVVEAVAQGELAEAVLDEAAARLLTFIFKAAETPKGQGSLDIEAHHALARQIAGEALVLLKNERQLLPLKPLKQTLAVIGQAAQEPYFQGGGSSHITPTQVDIPLEMLKQIAAEAEFLYAQGYTMRDEFNQALIDEAAATAARADVALLFVALPGFKESEGYDRGDMDLTRQQVALIQAVAGAQPNVVVILNNGSAVTMQEWLDAVPAVLEAWMPGQAGGGAIADVLFGRVNPSGKLAETFPLRVQDTPAYLNFPGENGRVRYGEGLFIGYRYYEAKALDVLFPFGYGLSYTTFAYTNLRLSAGHFKDVNGLKVTVDITNTGSMAGQEVVQVYVHDHAAKLIRPHKELKGFAKIGLAPGETKSVTIDLDTRAFAYYHPAYRRWVTESGEFDILVGRSSADICLKETVFMETAEMLPSLLHRDSTLKEWLEDPQGAAVLEPLLRQIMAPFHQGSDEERGALGVDMINMMRDVPLAALLRFFGSGLSDTPERFVGTLLARVHTN